MPFDELLADRIRPLLSRKKGLSEKKAFGGVGFLLHGNMLVGVWKNSLIVRIGPDSYECALLGAQAVGGAGVDKRIDVLAVAIQAGMTVFDLEEMELAYAP